MERKNRTTIYAGPFVRSKMFCVMFHFLNKFNWSMWGYPKIQSQSLLLNQSTCVQTNLHRRIPPQPTMAVGCNDICADSTRYNGQTSFPLLLLFPACHWFPVLLPSSNGMKTNPVYFTFPKFKFFIINTHDLVFFVHQWNLLLKPIRSISCFFFQVFLILFCLLDSYLNIISYFQGIHLSWSVFTIFYLSVFSFCLYRRHLKWRISFTMFFFFLFAQLFSFFVVHTFFQFSYISFFLNRLPSYLFILLFFILKF